MTTQELRDIAADAGLAHAEYCLEQHETQAGSDAGRELWDELSRLVWAEYEDTEG